MRGAQSMELVNEAMVRVGVDVVAEIGEPVVSNTDESGWTRRAISPADASSRNEFTAGLRDARKRKLDCLQGDVRQHQAMGTGRLSTLAASTSWPIVLTSGVRPTGSRWLAADRGGQPQQQHDRDVALAGLDLGDVALGNAGAAGELPPRQVAAQREDFKRSPSSARNAVSE